MLRELFTSIIIVVVFIILLYINIALYTWDDDLRRKDNIPVENPIKVYQLKDMKIYIINLEKRIDRKEHTIKLLDKLGFRNYEFIIPIPPDVAIQDPLMYGTTLTPTQASNTLTFFKIFREATENEYIIMEDDVNIYRDDISIDNIYNSAKYVDWDLIYLEFCFEDCLSIRKVTDFLYKLVRPICTGFVIYKKETAKKLLENYNRNDRAKDRYFSDLNREHIINSYGYPLFKQDPSLGSDLQGSYKYGKINDIDTPICKY